VPCDKELLEGRWKVGRAVVDSGKAHECVDVPPHIQDPELM